MNRTNRTNGTNGWDRLKLMGTICLAALAVMVMYTAPPVQAQDTQGQAQTFGTGTNIPATVATATSTACTNYIALRSRSGLGLQTSFNVSSGTSNVVYLIYSSVDGTNFGTTPFATWIMTATGTNAATYNTNWDDLKLRGFAALNIGAVTNQNAGTLTNLGVIWNRPNLP